jgi:hypothetical protein
VERVAFLIEDTNQVLRCMLNPETLVVRRTAGIHPRRSASGPLTGAGLADDPLVYTGGGRTILELDLLFDLDLSDAQTASARDVRDRTGPLWQMAENTRQSQRYAQPPQVRFLWGRAWNVPAVVLAVAERFERFTPQGQARRSWLRLRLLRVNDLAPQPRARDSFTLADVPTAPAEAGTQMGAPDETWGAHELIQGQRLDQLATRTYGDPALWRLIAVANEIDDPSDVASGRLLRLPPKPLKRQP